MRLSLLILGTALLASSAHAGAPKASHTETFSTTQYRDSAATTLVWDTSSHSLHFPPFFIEQFGAVATPGTARATAWSGDIVLVADGTGGLLVVDTSDPANPTIAASLALGGDARDIVIDGDIAYVSTGTAVVAVNITTVTAPSVAGSLVTSGDARGLALSGDLLYVADGSAGLKVVNVMNPASMWLRGTSTVPGDARAVAVRADVAYVANGTGGLEILDIIQPTIPTPISSLATPGTASGIAVDGHKVYIAAGAAGLVVVDVTTAALPSVVAVLDTPGDAVDISLDGDYAYVCDGVSGLQVIDITVPSNPTVKNTYASGGVITGMSANGNYGFLADGAGLDVVRLAEPMPPLVMGTTHDMDDHFEIEGEYLFMREWSTGMDYISVIDISNPSNPIHVKYFSVPLYELGHFAVEGDYLYVATQPDQPYGAPHSLRVYDISNVLSPVLVGETGGLQWFRFLIPHGNYLFSSQYVFDITNPLSPSVAATLPEHVSWTAIHGNYLYGAATPSSTNDFFLAIYNITNPASPVYLGAPLDINWPQGLVPFGDQLFFGDLHYFYVMDITSPTAPVITYQDNLDAYGGTTPVVTGDRLFTTPRADIHEYDISNPALPVRRQNYIDYYYYQYPEDQLRHGDYLIIGNSTDRYTTFFLIQQRGYFYSENVAQSTELDDTDALGIVTATLTPTSNNPNTWYLTANGGTNWYPVQPGETFRFPGKGNDIRWRAEFPIPASAGATTVSQVEVTWQFDAAVIDSIIDVPDDQGGWVRVHFSASGLDRATESSLPISHYDIRRVADDQTVLTVFAATAPRYAARVPTRQDGVPETFTVIAHTGGFSFESPPDSASSSDNKPPGVPQAVAATRTAEGDAALSWKAPPGPDVDRYRIYQAQERDFALGETSLLAETRETSWHGAVDRSAVFFRITALDKMGNESEAAAAELPALVPEAPTRFALYQNHPNPFNPMTTIRYDVPASGAWVTIRIYDVGGHEVRTLVNGPVEAGERRATWDGRDDRGAEVASGVYLYRLETPLFAQTRKLMLLR